jgi:hypothetical protein
MVTDAPIPDSAPPPSRESFELHRLGDGLTYRFRRATRVDGSVGYRREDQDLWILRSPTHGWVAVDESTGAITGRPWTVLPQEQGDCPPEGEWVSKKGANSHVYQLRYVDDGQVKRCPER